MKTLDEIMASIAVYGIQCKKGLGQQDAFVERKAIQADIQALIDASAVKWVKSFDRLPPPYRVQVTASDGKKALVMIGDYHSEFGWTIDDCELEDFGLSKDANVIAWRELPKPWSGE